MDNNLGPTPVANASDSTIKLSAHVTVMEPDSIPSVDPFVTAATTAGRVNQQSMIPSSVTNRILGSIISSSASGLGNASFLETTMTVAQTISFDFFVSDTKGRTIIAVPDIGVYVGSISPDNQYPTALYNPATLQVSSYNNWGLTDNINTVTSVVVRSNFVDPIDVIVVCRWRVITNPTVALAQSSTSSGQQLTPSQAQYGGAGGGGI